MKPEAAGRPSLVVFDIGGVLVRICRSWKEACIAAREPFHDMAATPEAMVARKKIVRQYEVGKLTCDEFCDKIVEASGGVYSSDQFRRIHDAFLLREYPGVAVLIEAIQLAGVDTAILSNTNASHWERLAPPVERPSLEFPTPRRTGHLFASHLLHMGKPQAEVYRFVATRLNVAPGSILFFDDAEENVAAARAEGWRAEQIDASGDPAAQMYAHCRAHGVIP